MTRSNPLWHGLKAPALVVLVMLALGWHTPARAGQLDCEAMAFSLNPGDQYNFQIKIQSQSVRLEKGDDFCEEPVATWFKRQLILPAPAKETSPRPAQRAGQVAKDNVPLPGSQRPASQLPDLGIDTDESAVPIPIQREFVKPKVAGEEGSEDGTGTGDGTGSQGLSPDGVATGVQANPDEQSKEHVSSDPEAELETSSFGVVAPPPPTRDPALSRRCDRDLATFWSPGEHEIEGNKFWLSGVFTVDLDGDGRIDDVGFKIKSDGRIGNILNYYPSTEGRLAGKNVKTLKLDDDKDIHRLCPGNVTFERPDLAQTLQNKRKAAQAALTKEAVEKKKEEDAAAEAAAAAIPPKKDVSPFVFVVGGIAMVLLLAGGIGLAIVVRNLGRSKDDEDDDDEDDDDDN